MAGLYEEQILGAKNRAETARRLREQAAVTGAPQGQMIGNYYVAPHWTQHLANAIRQYNLGSDEQEALKEASGLQRQQAREIADLSVKAGIPVSPEMIKRASVPAQEPGFVDRLTAALRGEEAKGVPEQVYQPPKIQNVTPDQREQALLSMVQVDPKIGGAMLDYMATKSHRQELAEDRQAAREERQAAREEALNFKRDMWNATHGGQPISDTGINMGPRISTAQGWGAGGVNDRKNMRLTTVNGQKALVNIVTGEVQPLGDAGATSVQPKYDSSSDQWVYPPSQEHPAGMVTPAPGKIGALENFNEVAKKLEPVVNQLETGGFAGYKQYTAPLLQKDLSNTFDNRVQQLSGELRKIMRIPGEGTLSDKEQAQYGLQLPNKSFSPNVNAQIIKDLSERVKTSVAPPGVSVPVPAQPKSEDTSVDDLVKKYGGK